MIILKLITSTICAGLLGCERDHDKKHMGFRSSILLCNAITVLSIIAIRLFNQGFTLDISRLPSYILAGIGFLGAGIIIKKDTRIYGITTACVLFALVGIGLSIGFGYYDLGIALTVLSYLTLISNRLIKSTPNEEEE